MATTGLNRDLAEERRSYRVRLFVAVAVCAVCIAAACLFTNVRIQNSRMEILEHATLELEAQKSYFADRLADWCQATSSAAEDISRSGLVQLYAGGASQGASDADLAEYMRDHLRDFAATQGVRQAFMASSKGQVYVTTAGADKLPGDLAALATASANAKTTTFGLGSYADKEGFVAMSVPVFAPAAPENAAPSALLLLGVPLKGRFADVLVAPPSTSGGAEKIAFVAPMDASSAVVVSLDQNGKTSARTEKWTAPEYGKLSRDTEDGVYRFALKSDGPVKGWFAITVDPAVIDGSISRAKHDIIMQLVSAIVVIFIIFMVFFLREDLRMEKNFSSRIARQKFLLDSINASVSLGMVLLSEKGEVLHVNPNFCEITGASDKTGVNLATCVPEQMAADVMAGVASVLASKQEKSVETTMLREDGEKRLFRVQLYPYRPEKGDKLKGESRNAIAIFTDITEFRKRAIAQRKRVENMLLVFSSAVESAESGLKGHTAKVIRVLELCEARLGLTRDEEETLRIAARMSPVGKLFVPREILTKKGKLTPEELATVRKAPEMAYELLKSLNFGLPVADVVYQLGERMNGKGNPRHLQGEEILRTARVLAIANAYCAMVSPRGYRAPLTPEQAIAQLKTDDGFDQQLVDVLAGISVDELAKATQMNEDAPEQA